MATILIDVLLLVTVAGAVVVGVRYVVVMLVRGAKGCTTRRCEFHSGHLGPCGFVTKEGVENP